MNGDSFYVYKNAFIITFETATYCQVHETIMNIIIKP